ncbi:MAG: PilZ domain-containing protein [Desulfovibrionaceae bacterium]
MELLEIGDRVLLQFGGLGDRFVAVVAGRCEEDHLLLYADLPAATLEHSRRNPAVTVRFAVESSLLGFRSRLLERDGLPGRLLRVACPERIENMDLRAERRCPVRWPARLHRGATQAPGMVRDVSPGALRLALTGEDGLALQRLLEPDDLVRLSFHTLDPARRHQADCTVLKTFLHDGRPFAVLALSRRATALARLLADYVAAVLGPPPA